MQQLSPFPFGNRKILSNKPLNFEVILSSDLTPKANLATIETVHPIAFPLTFFDLSTIPGNFKGDESPALYLWYRETITYPEGWNIFSTMNHYGIPSNPTFRNL